MGFELATIIDLSSTDPTKSVGLQVRFNPTEYQLQRNMSYAEVQVPGLESPLLQFVRGEAQTLALELFLDASDRVNAGKTGKGIQDDIAALRRLVTIQSELHAPPVIRFAWGVESFDGVVTTYGEKFVLFDQEGNAVRARVTLQLKRYTPAILQIKEADPQSPDRTKTRVVREGERIDTIAAEVYGDPAFWPAIARANGLSRPRILTVGQLLVIPPL
ncbi:MAG: peptidoglycan-binding protein [Kofleriaceae bacterium]